MTSPLIYRQLTQGTGNSGVLGAGDEAGFFSDYCTLQEPKNKARMCQAASQWQMFHLRHEEIQGSKRCKHWIHKLVKPINLNKPFQNACTTFPIVLELMKPKPWRLEIFFLKPHQHFRMTRLQTGPILTLMACIIWASHICHDGKTPWRCTLWPYSSQWCEPSEPRYLFLQDCSTLSSATRVGDLNELLVHPQSTSLVPDEFWCRSVALCKSYVQHASLQANWIQKYNMWCNHTCKIDPVIQSYKILSHCTEIFQANWILSSN